MLHNMHTNWVRADDSTENHIKTFSLNHYYLVEIYYRWHIQELMICPYFEWIPVAGVISCVSCCNSKEHHASREPDGSDATLRRVLACSS